MKTSINPCEHNTELLIIKARGTNTVTTVLQRVDILHKPYGLNKWP
jgi:hypothetical protein